MSVKILDQKAGKLRNIHIVSGGESASTRTVDAEPECAPSFNQIQTLKDCLYCQHISSLLRGARPLMPQERDYPSRSLQVPCSAPQMLHLFGTECKRRSRRALMISKLSTCRHAYRLRQLCLWVSATHRHTDAHTHRNAPCDTEHLQLTHTHTHAHIYFV